MNLFLDGVTGQLVSFALDATLQRHEVIANNIANVNTQGYQPLRLEFEQHLQHLGQVLDANPSKQRVENEIGFIRQELLSPSVDTQAAQVMLDEEMVAMTKNTLHYDALLTASSKFGSLMKTAVRGGR